MIFHSATYAVFLVLVFAAFWALAARRSARVWLLLAASYLFYGCWNAKYLLLILGSTVWDYALAARLAGTPVAQRRRRLLLVGLSVAGNLSLLGVFKYYGFFRTNIAALTGLDLPLLDVLLPVGISFYTFQSLSYTIDVYRGVLGRSRSLPEFALFVSFFPQLVAGPIVRARDFLPQLERPPSATREDLHQGLWRIVVGLTKKVLIADVLGTALVDPAYRVGADTAGVAMWLAMLGYAFQLFCDFSGYSDIAIGSARLFGFRLLENFDRPYNARSLQDFWRRWHISLSFWLRDYLYFSLGGSRRGEARTYANLTVTMLLSGLWHGANWTFVVWGALHAVGMVLNRAWSRLRPGRLEGPLGRIFAWLITFLFATLAFVVFRAVDLAHAADLFARLLRPGGDGSPLPADPVLWAAMAGAAATHLVPRRTAEACARGFSALPSPVVGVVLALFLGLLAAAGPTGVPFVYFQF